jgi:hypothetical protein
MFDRNMVKTVFGSVNRSDFYYLITSIRSLLHTNHGPDTRFDAVGGVMVISLSAGIVVLMRLMVAH